jgi:hypothetical protein
MLSRCRNPNVPSFRYYGGKGISVCQRWLSFENFIADMGPRPFGGTLERSDNDIGYQPDNCRWASTQVQARNRSVIRHVTIGDTTMCLKDWAHARGLPYKTVWMRLHNGWSIERALQEPVRQHGASDRANSDSKA